MRTIRFTLLLAAMYLNAGSALAGDHYDATFNCWPRDLDFDVLVEPRCEVTVEIDSDLDLVSEDELAYEIRDLIRAHHEWLKRDFKAYVDREKASNPTTDEGTIRDLAARVNRKYREQVDKLEEDAQALVKDKITKKGERDDLLEKYSWRAQVRSGVIEAAKDAGKTLAVGTLTTGPVAAVGAAAAGAVKSGVKTACKAMWTKYKDYRDGGESLVRATRQLNLELVEFTRIYDASDYAALRSQPTGESDDNFQDRFKATLTAIKEKLRVFKLSYERTRDEQSSLVEQLYSLTKTNAENDADENAIRQATTLLGYIETNGEQLRDADKLWILLNRTAQTRADLDPKWKAWVREMKELGLKIQEVYEKVDSATEDLQSACEIIGIR